MGMLFGRDNAHTAEFLLATYSSTFMTDIWQVYEIVDQGMGL